MMQQRENIHAHLAQRGYLHKSNLVLDGQTFAELFSPTGSSMVVAMGSISAPGNTQQVITYKKKSSLFPGIARDLLLNIIRETNGLTRAMIMEGKYLFLTTDPSPVRPDREQIITGDEYELTDSSAQNCFRAVPVITLEEFLMDEASCLRLCERVSSRIHNKMLTELVDSRETLDKLHPQFVSLAQEYFAKQSDVLHNLVSTFRCHKDICRYAGDPQKTSNSKDILHHHEQQLETLHSHAMAIRQMCVTLQAFNQRLADYHPSVTEMRNQLL